MSTSDKENDLLLALMAQNNLLVALVRSHPNRDILATSFEQAQKQFPDAVEQSKKNPERFPVTANTIKSFETAMKNPLDPLEK